MVTARPSVTAGRSEFIIPRLTGVPMGDAPSLIATSYTITADIGRPADGGDGMLVTRAARFAGGGFYLLKGKPVFTLNLVDLKRERWKAPKLSRRQAYGRV